jgi:hypothetical protein
MSSQMNDGVKVRIGGTSPSLPRPTSDAAKSGSAARLRLQGLVRPRQ